MADTVFTRIGTGLTFSNEFISGEKDKHFVKNKSLIQFMRHDIIKVFLNSAVKNVNFFIKLVFKKLLFQLNSWNAHLLSLANANALC